MPPDSVAVMSAVVLTTNGLGDIDKKQNRQNTQLNTTQRTY